MNNRTPEEIAHELLYRGVCVDIGCDSCHDSVKCAVIKNGIAQALRTMQADTRRQVIEECAGVALTANHPIHSDYRKMISDSIRSLLLAGDSPRQVEKHNCGNCGCRIEKHIGMGGGCLGCMKCADFATTKPTEGKQNER